MLNGSYRATVSRWSFFFLFVLPGLVQNFHDGGDFNVWKLVIQRLVVGKLKDPFSYPEAKDGKQLLCPFFRKLLVCGDLSRKLGDLAGPKLCNAVLSDGEYLSYKGTTHINYPSISNQTRARRTI